ncbi:uncharacterized protein LOC132199691 isoform X2 [Neocloeon triangulifer]|uniref:uncharacterized protein LOC132199691 isoform X2 n=1 Tax=Neocloeon triangulifer TaxID=2078957 RepID=UPI00286F0215|nr:uncharacterized protein LOC132199691 isoform X2 [Neocloeon triangulifer]
MPQCAVSTCRNSHRKTKGRRVRYHRFPAEESVRERWVAVCGRQNWFNTTTARVCSLHFSPNSYERDVEHELLGLPPRSRLRRGAVPDLHVPVVVPSLINKLYSAPPPQRNVAPNRAKNKKQPPPLVKPPPEVDTPPPEESPDEAAQLQLLNALGLQPKNNDVWAMAAYGLPVGQTMPVMDAAGAKKQQRAMDEGVPQRRSSLHNGELEEAASEGEAAVARAAAALVTVDIDEGAKPLDFSASENNSPVKAEPSSEHATSSGCGTDDEESPRSSVARNKRGLKEAAGEPEAKRARMLNEEIEEDERERTIRTFVEANEGPEEAARCVEVLKNELSMLRQLAEQKEHEWNQLIRLKGLKEEMLARLERRRVVLGHKPPKANGQQPVIGEGRQGPILDVRSIIADYRQRHPEQVPRRGRRLRPQSPETCSMPTVEPPISFKDVLVKFAKMSQNEPQGPRLPYPEVTLHPVPPPLGPASSLLQGILTKPGNRSTNFSPTLARLLTAPERPTPPAIPAASPSVSISDLLGPSKGRTEITITPVGTSHDQPAPSKSKTPKPVPERADDDTEGDRLVIDEPTSSEQPPKKGVTKANTEEMDEEDVPECQGCHRNQAQFVCAGCGNQWYCSRECQVSAWDEHADVCSG